MRIAGFPVRIDPTLPKDEVRLEDASGRVLVRLINLRDEQQAERLERARRDVEPE